MSAVETPDGGPGQRVRDADVPPERGARSASGLPWLVAAVVLVLGTVASLVLGIVTGAWPLFALLGVLVVAAVVIVASFYMVTPNQAAVLSLFGDYRGTDRASGLRIANPLYSSRPVSLRVRNFTTSSSKVNDANGNPILVAAVVVWQVTDTAKAVFGVEDHIHYVQTQAEAAVRHLARSYPYDTWEHPEAITLIGDTGQVGDGLQHELQERAAAAGVSIIETRITDLSYAPEIAEAMLRRQQASAIVAARAKIVEGAVYMVRAAVAELERGTDGGDSIPLDNDVKATFACNLMTVIASDHPTTPVVNVGTLNR